VDGNMKEMSGAVRSITTWYSMITLITTCTVYGVEDGMMIALISTDSTTLKMSHNCSTYILSDSRAWIKVWKG
jgi:hypothetical protein